MRHRRNNAFDINRRMEEQMRNVIEQQEAQIAALQARIEQINAAQAQRQAQQPAQFTLSPEQFLNYVIKLRKFTGKDEYTAQEFINTVERTFLLCQNNQGLRDYATGIIINEKIQGEAKRCIQRLGANIENRWEDVKREIKLHFRPREDYSELLNKCRSLRVSTLRELFDTVRDINYKLNELYEFDDIKPVTYSPSNNDKYLVDIISSKVHDFLRGNIPENATIIEIYNKFEKLKLLDNESAVDFKSRKNKVNAHKNNKSENQINQRPNKSNYFSNNNSSKYNPSPSNTNKDTPNLSNNKNNNHRLPQRSDYNNYRNFNNNYSGQFRNRTQNSNNIQERQNQIQNRNDSPPEPMEIGNFDHDEDVNFQNEPRNQECQ